MLAYVRTVILVLFYFVKETNKQTNLFFPPRLMVSLTLIIILVQEKRTFNKISTKNKERKPTTQN